MQVNEMAMRPTLRTRLGRESTTGREEIIVDVVYENAGVDRPHTSSIAFWNTPAKRRLVARFMRAVAAGRLFYNAKVKTDVNGKTFVSYESGFNGRHLNAELRRLGY